MDRQVLGDISIGRPTSQAMALRLMHESFLTPSPDPRPAMRQTTIHESIQAYGNIKRQLNWTEAHYQLHKNNILHEDSDEDDDDEDDEDVLGSFETPPKTPKPGQRKGRNSSSTETPGGQSEKAQSAIKSQKPKRQRVQRTPKAVALSTQLSGLTRQQLLDLVVGISDAHPELEEEIRQLMPSPDLTEMEKRLDYLNHNIFKSFPYTRYGSSRDAFCFRRVKVHLAAFKKDCIEQGKTLMNSESWEAVIDYALMAWKYVEKMPNWDNPPHNAQKSQCFKALASQCKQALKKSCLEKEKYHQIKERLEKAVEDDSVMESCVEEVIKILDKLP